MHRFVELRFKSRSGRFSQSECCMSEKNEMKFFFFKNLAIIFRNQNTQQYTIFLSQHIICTSTISPPIVCVYYCVNLLRPTDLIIVSVRVHIWITAKNILFETKWKQKSTTRTHTQPNTYTHRTRTRKRHGRNTISNTKHYCGIHKKIKGKVIWLLFA